MSKVATIDLKGKEYALVPQRLKKFREDHPKSKTETDFTKHEDGSITFKAWLWKDKSDYLDMLKEVKDLELARGSADADGDSKGKLTDEKAFEKLQTIALGRALAMLGYLNNGQIATTEEMEEFNQYKQDQLELALAEIKNATKRDEFAGILAKLTPEQQRQAAPVITERIQELKEAADGNADQSGTKKS